MIRGKIPNAFKTSRASFLANQEIASIITIIGGGYGRNFDINKVKFDKIIFLADADPDKVVAASVRLSRNTMKINSFNCWKLSTETISSQVQNEKVQRLVVRRTLK